MAKWSDKMMGGAAVFRVRAEGDYVFLDPCPICNNAMCQCGPDEDTCPDCGEGTCEHAAPDSARDEDTCPDCGNSICDCWLEDVDDNAKDYIVRVNSGYQELFLVLTDALDQAQDGKGAERHGNGLSFTDQPALTITRAVGRGFPLGQAMKKIQESQRMDDDAAKRELLGAINYLAAAILSFDE